MLSVSRVLLSQIILFTNAFTNAFTNTFTSSLFTNKLNQKMIANTFNYPKNKYSDFTSYQSRFDSGLNNPTIIQGGGTLRTWSYKSPHVEQVHVQLSSQGRPIDSDVELWQGPDNTPCKMRVYTENGAITPFYAVIETPQGPNTIAIRNIGQFEFPLLAEVNAENIITPSAECLNSFMAIQGGAIRTYPFSPVVESSQIMIRTDGRPLNARIELLQGPNNNRQVIELYTDDGLDKPFFCILKTPGAGNVIRILNTSPIEFPLQASVTPNSIEREVNMNPNTNTEPVFGY